MIMTTTESDIIVVDAGGTTSKFAIFRYGKLVNKIKLPSSHILQVGREKMLGTLAQGIEEVKLDRDFKIVFGLAGFGSDQKIRDEIKNSIKDRFSLYDYYLTNDVELAYYSEFARTTGILLILGTGSIGYKYENNKFIRTGGWGYKIGDEASGYDLGIKLIKAFCKEADNRAKKTDLYFRVREYLTLENDYDLILRAQNMTRTEIASLSELVFDLYKKGNIKAIEIINSMVDEITCLISALDDGKLNKVVLFGGLTKSDIGLDKLIKGKLRDDLDVVIGKNNALRGGYELSKEVFS